MRAHQVSLPPHFLAYLLAACTILAPLSEASAERWIWVRGDHHDQECDHTRTSLEGSLSAKLIELLHVDLMYDGQRLTCTSSDCARVRILAAGAQHGLLGQSRCLNGVLDYQLSLVSLDETETPLIYKKSVPIDAPTDEIQGAGALLARRVIKGPAPPKKTASRSRTSITGLALGVIIPEPALTTQVGVSFMADFSPSLDRLSHSLSYRLGGVINSLSGDSIIRASTGLFGGLVWRPLQGGLDPYLSAGIITELVYQEMATRDRQPLNQRGDLILQRERIEQTIYVDLRPYLEVGAQWSGSKLFPAIGLRYSPVSIVDDPPWAALTSFFALRW